YKFVSQEKGVKVVLEANPNYWGGPVPLQQVVIRPIAEMTAAVSALLAGEVQLIASRDSDSVEPLRSNAQFDFKTANMPLSNPWIFNMAEKPFDDKRVRQALNWAVDRDTYTKTILKGLAQSAKSVFGPAMAAFNPSLPGYTYDPDKAKFYLKKSGVSSITAPLSASDAAFNGAVDAALLFQANAKAAGVDFPLKKEPADGFWDNVWLKAPFCESYWGGRPCATMMMTVAMTSSAAWNETGWKVPAFDKLLADAKKEIDHDKRKAMIFELQRMTHDDGGAVVPAFKSWVDAAAQKVKNYKPYSLYDLCNTRVAEMVWIDES
ncbi:MAG TPA: ABC transporter substrate-binding protein, partial [Dongiaceae bacterium]|nr:ABC transporter substrate-binding protein [Dongiaceae bacterium]